MICPDCTHPLEHNGTSQKERLALALFPESVRLDSRSTAEVLHFAYEFAALLKYFNLKNEEDGNWQCFFNKGPLGMLAIVSAIDLAAIDEAYCQAEVDFWRKPKEVPLSEWNQTRAARYQVLIEHIYEVAKKIHKICSESPFQHPIREEILEIIRSNIVTSVFDDNIRNALKVLIAYDKGNQPARAVPENEKDPYLEEKYAAFIYSTSNQSVCAKTWDIKSQDQYYCISPDDGFIEEQTGACKENKNLRALFLLFFQALSKIVDRAQFYLDKALRESHAQEPHITLFLTFVQLFKHLQAQLNQLPRLHLNYYFEQVLGLSKHSFTPDHAYVVFDLAQTFSEFKLEAGTLLDARKDDKGNNLQYALEKELVVNRSSISGWEALYLSAADGEYEKLYSLAATNNGKISCQVPLRWRFLQPTNPGKLKTGAIGFAVSDPILKLSEGLRFIVMEVEVDNLPVELTDVANYFDIYYSSGKAENGWVKLTVETLPQGVDNGLKAQTVPGAGEDYLPKNSYNYKDKDGEDLTTTPIEGNRYTAQVVVGNEKKFVEFRLLLRPDQAAVEAVTGKEALLEKSRFPFIKVVLNQENSHKVQPWISEIQITNIRLRVDVQGLKQGVTIRNELAAFNNQGSFPLLGVNPTTTKGTFLEFDLEELKGKQIGGMTVKPDFIDKNLNVDTYDDEKAFMDLFSPEFQYVQDALVYSANAAPIGFPSLPGKSGNPAIPAQIFDLATVVPDTGGFQSGTDIEDLTPGAGLYDPGTGYIHPGDAFKDRENLHHSRPLATNPTTQLGFGSILNPANRIIMVEPTLSGNWKPIVDSSIIRKNKWRTSAQTEIQAEPYASGLPLKGYSSLQNQNILTLKYEPAAAVKMERANVEVAVAKNDLNQPQIVKKIAFRYTSFADYFTTQSGINFYKKEFKRFQITPTGYNPVPQECEHFSLLPLTHFLPLDAAGAVQIPTEQDEVLSMANLDIAISNLVPGQSLSLLFQMVDGTGNANYDPPDVYWYFLTKGSDGQQDAWLPFPAGAIVEDSTKTDPKSQKSLLQTGIIRFNTPVSMARQAYTLSPESGNYWIRAIVVERPDIGERIVALPDIKEIVAQAGVALFQNNGNTLSHLQSGLPANTIIKLVNPPREIREVKQPLSTFGGRPPEGQNEFYRRVSERLRHKDRAITLWDYERLVLEAYPEIRHVKGLTHSSKECVMDPGNVMLVVFPNLEGRTGIDRFTPGCGIGKLEEIEDYLRKRANLFLFCGEHIQAVNPSFEPIFVECCVRFYPEHSPDYYAKQLTEDLHRFLAPWAYDGKADILFGGTLHTSHILNFIEERPYVDIVTSFGVYHFVYDPESGDMIDPITRKIIDPDTGRPYDTSGDPVEKIKGEVIRATTDRSVFTTFPNTHAIRIWGSEECQDSQQEDLTHFNIC